ncbi:MAG: hypothetical protein IJ438_11680 [Clostridia bacterium]|nr:hypothetical protein [Clostridia bacterium]
MNQQKQAWTLLAAVAVGVILPHTLDAWYVVLAVMALPVAAAVLTNVKQELPVLIIAAGLGVATLPILPAAIVSPVIELPPWLLWPVGLWLAACAAYPLVRSRLQGRQHAIYWGAVCGVTVLLTLVLAMQRYGGSVTDGLAASICARIETMPLLQKSAFLYTLFQSGLARLETEVATVLETSVKIGGALGVSPEVQEQILFSFRTTLEKTFPALLPETILQWGIGTTVLCVLLGDAALRSHRGKGEMKAFPFWHMPTQLGRMMLLALLLGAVQLFTSNVAVAQTAIMCRTLGYWAFVVQGAACLYSVLSDHGGSVTRCVATNVIAVLLAPFVLELIGIYDQFRDPRELREDVQEKLRDHDDNDF